MNQQAVIDGILTALANSAAIAAWCQTNYVKNQTVYFGANQEDPPPESDYPLLLLDVPTVQSGLASEEHQLQLLLGVGLFDASAPVVSGKIVRYAAKDKLLALRALAFAEIAAAVSALTDGGIIAMIETSNDPLEAWPEYSSVSMLTVVCPWAVRENRIV